MPTRSAPGELRPGDAVAVAGVAVGGAITVTIGEVQWDLWGIPPGLMLLLILTGFVSIGRVARDWEKTQQLAYAMIAGMCLMIMVAWVVEIYLRHGATYFDGKCHMGPFEVGLYCADPLGRGEWLWHPSSTPSPSIGEPMPLNSPGTSEEWGMPLNSLVPLILWVVASLAVFGYLRWRKAQAERAVGHAQDSDPIATAA